jgi:uncharacterized heparinase superfamily protein
MGQSAQTFIQYKARNKFWRRVFRGRIAALSSTVLSTAVQQTVAAVPRLPLRQDLLAAINPPAFTPARLRRAESALRGKFLAVGESFELGLPPNWSINPSSDREWQIEHHKLEIAVDLALAWEASGRDDFVEAWRQLVHSWLCQMGTGELPFSDAQVEAKRIDHWLQSLAVLQRSEGLSAVPVELVQRLTTRIRMEAGYVMAHLRPARNHRTIQLHSAFMASTCLSNWPSTDKTQTQSFDLLCQNLLDDFGPDGVHVELSTHYHQLTVQTALAFVRIAETAGMRVPDLLVQRIKAALEFSRWIALPDGDIPLIGDSDAGSFQALLEAGASRFLDEGLAWVATEGRLGRAPHDTSRWFANAGYLCARDGWGSAALPRERCQHLFADFGELGAGSHAHYDLFNFCWSVGGQQLIVDPGRFTYNAEADANGVDWRHAFKCTAAHNTVAIDGLSQTRYLSKARRVAPGLEAIDRVRHPSKHGPPVAVARREVHAGRRSDWIRGTALSQEYAPQHSRLLAYVQRRYILVVDDVRSDDGKAHVADWRLHLAAAWSERIGLGINDTGFRAQGPGWHIDLIAPGATCALESGWVSTCYGHKEPAPVLHASLPFTRTGRFTALLAPRREDWAITGFESHSASDPAVTEVRVWGHEDGREWSDRFRIGWLGPIEQLGARYRGRSAFVHERRSGRLTTHLLVERPEAWVGFGQDMQGHLEC